jgi:hypothetical protein
MIEAIISSWSSKLSRPTRTAGSWLSSGENCQAVQSLNGLERRSGTYFKFIQDAAIDALYVVWLTIRLLDVWIDRLAQHSWIVLTNLQSFYPAV